MSRTVAGRAVFPVGMGAMTLTQTVDTDSTAAVAAVAAACEAGVTLFDTADSYGPTSEYGVNERFLVRALQDVGADLDEVLIATKGGHTRGPNATWWIDGTPRHIARAARDSLRRLGLAALPLYQHHRPSPWTPFAESMGALRQLVEDGVARRVGVSNVSAAQLRTAIEVIGAPLASVQNECSPDVPADPDVLALCEAHGLAFLAYAPLGGRTAAKSVGSAGPLAAVAAARGVSPQRVAIAYVLGVSPVVVPIPGASRASSIRDSAAAVALALTESERALIEGQAA